MLDLTIAFDTPRSSADVFGFIADGFFAHHRRWDPAIVELRKTTDGDVGVGTRGVEVRRFLARQEAEFEIVEFDRPAAFAFRNTSGPFELDRRYTVSETASGSHVEFRFQMRPRVMAVRAGWRLLRPVIGRQVRANIDRLATLLEADQPAVIAGP